MAPVRKVNYAKLLANDGKNQYRKFIHGGENMRKAEICRFVSCFLETVWHLPKSDTHIV